MSRVLFFLLIMVSLTGCFGPSYYGIINHSEDLKHVTKPHYKDTTLKQLYVTASGVKSMDNRAFNDDESYYIGSIGLQHSWAWKFAGVGTGTSLHLGNYNVVLPENNEVFNTYTDIYGLNGYLEAYVNIPIRSVNWRIIGLKYTGKYESGGFANFRSILSERSEFVNVHPNNKMHSLVFSTSVAYKGDHFGFAPYFNLGLTLNNWTSLLTAFGFELQFEKMAVSAQAGIAAPYAPGTFFTLGVNFGVENPFSN